MYKLNLLPPELQRDISIDVGKLVKRLAATLSVVALLVGYGAFIFSYYSTKKEISKTEKYLNELQVTVKKVEDVKKQRQNNEQSAQKLKELLDKRLTWSYVLQDLNYNLPVDVWLENVDLSFVDLQASTGTAGQAPGQPGAQASGQAQQAQGQSQQASGQKQQPKAGQKGVPPPDSPPVPNTLTIEGYSRTVPSIGIFVNNLNKMPYFTRVTLNETGEDEKYAAVKFKITAAVREGSR